MMDIILAMMAIDVEDRLWLGVCPWVWLGDGGCVACAGDWPEPVVYLLSVVENPVSVGVKYSGVMRVDTSFTLSEVGILVAA